MATLLALFSSRSFRCCSRLRLLSETNFYLGKYYLSLGDLDSATALFKLAVANNVHNFVEHRYALLELSLLGQDQDDLAESDQQ